jgi:hypothetical protein
MSAIKNISLYIPHIFANYGKEDVAKVFHDLHIGKVKNIDFVSKLGQDGKPFNAAYIHFEHWFDNTTAANFQDKVLNPKKEARLMYEDPWYWIVLENKARKFVPGERKPRIDLGDFPALSASKDTPVKAKEVKKCPDAPVKTKSQTQPAVQLNSTNLSAELEAEVSDMEAQMEIDAEMDEIEALIEEEESHLVSIDSRYLQALEAENTQMRSTNFDLNAQLVCMQNALYAEQIKSLALAEAFGKMKKE